MKPILSLLAIIALALALTACGGSDPGESLSVEAERVENVGADAASEISAGPEYQKEKEGEGAAGQSEEGK